MPKQLLIYQSAVPVSASRHGALFFDGTGSYAFSAGINAVPLMAVEFLSAATEYAIVFTEAGDAVLPVVVLGIRPEQNLYLSAQQQWQAKYVPAFVRRYPFVFSSSEDRKTLTLCIDETHPGLNAEGRGQRLFDADRKPSAYVGQVLAYLQQYQASFERTRAFGQRLKQLKLLDPMQAQVSTPDGQTLKLGGFLAVQRDKLRALDGDTLALLAKTDELELLYLHLHSMRNFDTVKDRLVSTLAAAQDTASAATNTAASAATDTRASTAADSEPATTS